MRLDREIGLIPYATFDESEKAAMLAAVDLDQGSQI